MSDYVNSYKTALDGICPILASVDANVQGAVLADLFAMYLAGHMGEDRAAAREEVLNLWLLTVRQLVPIHEKMFLDKIRPRSH